MPRMRPPMWLNNFLYPAQRLFKANFGSGNDGLPAWPPFAAPHPFAFRAVRGLSKPSECLHSSFAPLSQDI